MTFSQIPIFHHSIAIDLFNPELSIPMTLYDSVLSCNKLCGFKCNYMATLLCVCMWFNYEDMTLLNGNFHHCISMATVLGSYPPPV